MHESANMRAIAIVSMMFLPGTFISVSVQFISSMSFSHEEQGILGTNLFSQAEQKSGPEDSSSSPFRASAQWWILPVTILVLTALTFVGWAVWRRISEDEIETMISNEDKKTTELQEYEPADPRAQRRRSSIFSIGSGNTRLNKIWSRDSRNERDLEMGKLPD